MSLLSAPEPSSLSPRLCVSCWQNVAWFLSAIDKTICRLVCKQLALIMRANASRAAERLARKRSVSALPHPPFSPSRGPSSRFLRLAKKRKKIEGSNLVIIEQNYNISQVVQTICQKERAHRPYVPLYHAMGAPVFIFSLFTKTALSIAYPLKESFPISFPLIRFPSYSAPLTVTSFHQQHPFQSFFYDHQPDVRAHLLACNPHLFSNLSEGGESTWGYFLTGFNVSPPEPDAFFQELCSQVGLSSIQAQRARLKQLHEQITDLSLAFEKNQLPASQRQQKGSRGMILQIFIPPHLLDQIAYASFPYGRPDTSTFSLAQRCEDLLHNPNMEPSLQVRVLIQPLFVQSHGIKVFVHGCGGFFSTEPLTKPAHLTAQEWKEQKNLLHKKEQILNEARALFTEMALYPNTSKEQYKKGKEAEVL